VRLAVDSLDPWALPRRGSDLSRGLEEALAKARARPGDRRAVVIFSDGEANRPGHIEALARSARAQGVRVDAVGVGTPDGAPIPVGRTLWGQETFRVYRHEVVRTRLSPLELRRAALLGGGRYLELSVPGAMAELAQDLTRWKRGGTPAETGSVRAEYFQAWLLWALLLLATELLWPLFRRAR
jgi:Ca-activated chloride channel homolog